MFGGFGFLRVTTSPRSEWSDIKLELCENGMHVAARLLGWMDMDTAAFNAVISNASFTGKGLSFSSQYYILFKVIASGDVDKLQVLRNLPSYDQMPFSVRDSATGKTTIDVAEESGNVLMKLTVQTIVEKQRMELEGGREALTERGYYNNSL